MTLTSHCLCGPDPNPMTIEECDALKSVMRLLPDNPVVIQIGAERGASTLAILEERPDAWIFSIDCGERPEERQNLERAGLDWRRVVRGLGRSQVIGEFWPWHWRPDALYIDGDHRRPGIDRDLQVWPRLVRPGGYVAIHDYIHPGDRGPQIQGRVWEAFNEWWQGRYDRLKISGRLLWWQVLEGQEAHR